MKTFYILLILLLLMPGCGTIIIMSESASADIIPYCGTIMDSVVFVTFITGGTEGTGLTSFDGIFLALWALLDLPFSLIADTLCLPYTILNLFF